MRSALLCFILVSGGLTAGAGSAIAADADDFQRWQRSFEEGRSQFYAGRAEKAREILSAGLKDGRAVKHTDDRFIRHLTLLGASLFMQSRFREAIPFYREAFIRMSSLPTECHPDPRVIFVARSRLGQCYYSQEKYSDAIRQFEQALCVKAKDITEDNQAECYRGLADSCFAINDYIQSEKYYELALQHASRGEIRSSSNYLFDILAQLAYLKARRRELDAASDYLARARERLAGSPESPGQAARLDELSEYISKARDYQKSFTRWKGGT